MTPLGLSWLPENPGHRESWTTGQEVLVCFILDNLPATIVQRGSYDCLVQYGYDGRCERVPYGHLRLKLTEAEERCRALELIAAGHPQADRVAKMLGIEKGRP